MVRRNGHGSGEGKGPQGRQQSKDQESGAKNFCVSGRVGHQQWKRKMQGDDVVGCKALGIGQFVRAVENHHHHDRQPKTRESIN